MSTRVLLADDHKILRDGLRELLERRAGVEVVAEAADGRTAVRLAQELRPDLVIMDVSMKELNGVEATRQIRAQANAPTVLALSMHTEREFLSGMLLAGASGYLLKDTAFDELTAAIDCVLGGGTYLSAAITDSVVSDYVQKLRDGSNATDDLTPREREVLQLLAEGKSTKEAASVLQVSAKTVETHRKNIMNKLDIQSVAELTKYAIRIGLTSVND